MGQTLKKMLQTWNSKLTIIIDTREQLPLWQVTAGGCVRMKLEVGDYTTLKLYGKAHIERKSPQDLYQTITSGHNRFRKEILRSQELNIELPIFVECSLRRFVNKTFKRGNTLKVPGTTLCKIINTLKSRYDLDFVWCKNREDMRKKVIEWLTKKQANYKA